MNRVLISALSLACVLGLVSSCSSAGGTDEGDATGAGVGPEGASTGGTKSSAGGTKSSAGGTSSNAGSSDTGGTSSGATGGTSSAQGGSGNPGAGGSSNGGNANGGTSSAQGGTGTAGTTSSQGGTSSNVGGTSSSGGTTSSQGGTSQAGTSAQGGTSSSTGGTGIAGVGGMADLVIVPADATLSPPAGVAPQLAYKAILQQMNAPDQDVTSQTTWSIGPPNFGSFNGSTFMAPVGMTGLATVEADAAGLSATTTITITPPQVVIGTGADMSSPGKFGGSTDPNAAIQLVYPANGVLVPPNMNSLEFHFIPASGQTLFQLDLESPNVSLKAYFGCTSVGSGCAFAPDTTFWKILANTARGGAAVSYTISGVNGASPGSVGVSATQTIQFSTQDITGGLYYWQSSVQTLIERYDFGYPDNPPENYLTTKQTGGLECVGCHVLSRDGTKILAGHDIPEPAAYTALDVATTTVLFKGPGGGNFFSFSPDASQYLASTGKDISLHDATTGAAIGSSFGPGTMPDWSPDGATIVYAKPTGATDCALGACAPGVVSAAIEIAPFANDVLGQAKDLVPFNGANNYYPAISPDGGFVIFNRSPSNEDSFANAAIQTDMNTGMTTSMPDGELWMVSINGGNPIELMNATTGSEAWPKWAPNVNTYEGGNIVWATFSSWRPYGLRTTQWEHAHLWMVAIDLQKLAQGEDGSFPAFWIPFQNINTENRIGQWVTQVQRQPCTSGGDTCPSQQICKLGRCVPQKM